MAHYCICPKCNIKFNRDKIQAVKISACRYGHASCYPDIKELVPMETSPSIDPDLKALNEYIAALYGNKGNYPLIKKQIKKFHDEYKYTYSGMQKSLIYFYEVKHNKIEDSNGGIGIIEYVYEQARQYYYEIFVAQNQNENKSFITKIKEYIIKPPKSKSNKRKELNWGTEEE